MIFTYTDKDGFVPASEADNRLTTGDGGVFSHLEEAVVNIPRNAASYSSTPRGGAGGARGDGTRSVTNTGVSQTAAAIQSHLAREDKFKASSVACCIWPEAVRRHLSISHHKLYVPPATEIYDDRLCHGTASRRITQSYFII